MVRVFGRSLKTISIQILTKENISMIRNMEKGNSFGLQAMCIKDLIRWMRGMGMERCTSLMGLCTKDNG
jgi:hypothetical protein